MRKSKKPKAKTQSTIQDCQKELQDLLAKQGTELITQCLLSHGRAPSMSIVLQFAPKIDKETK